MAKRSDERLFDDLEAWGQRKDSLLINDFLKEKKLSFDEFERLANSKKKYMKIWGQAESQAWENLLNALFKKSLPRSKIAEYINGSDICQNRDPEVVMHELEGAQIRLELYLTAIGDIKSLKKYGRIGLKMNDTEALMRCSLEHGMITQKDYEEIMAGDDGED